MCRILVTLPNLNTFLCLSLVLDKLSYFLISQSTDFLFTGLWHSYKTHCFAKKIINLATFIFSRVKLCVILCLLTVLKKNMSKILIFFILKVKKAILSEVYCTNDAGTNDQLRKFQVPYDCRSDSGKYNCV